MSIFAINCSFARSATPKGTDKTKYDKEVIEYYRPVADKMKKYKKEEPKKPVEVLKATAKKIVESNRDTK